MKEKDLVKLLKALANKRRLAILTYLKREKEANVGSISSGIRLSFKSTSRHLSILIASDILDREQRGLEMFYSISNDCPILVKRIINSF